MKLEQGKSSYPYEGVDHPLITFQTDFGRHFLNQVSELPKEQVRGFPTCFVIQAAKLVVWPTPDKTYELDIRTD